MKTIVKSYNLFIQGFSKIQDFIKNFNVAKANSFMIPLYEYSSHWNNGSVVGDIGSDDWPIEATQSFVCSDGMLTTFIDTIRNKFSG